MKIEAPGKITVFSKSAGCHHGPINIVPKYVHVYSNHKTVWVFVSTATMNRIRRLFSGIDPIAHLDCWWRESYGTFHYIKWEVT
jgi:hypothetical protein